MSSKCIARNTVSVQTVSQIKAAMTTWQTNFTHGIAIVLFSFRSGMVSTCSFRGLAAQKCAKTSCRAHSSEARSAVESNLRNPVILVPDSIAPMIRTWGNRLTVRPRHRNHCTNRIVYAGRKIHFGDIRAVQVVRQNMSGRAGRSVVGCLSWLALPFQFAGGIVFVAIP
jgi:hypothetical protein